MFLFNYMCRRIGCDWVGMPCEEKTEVRNMWIAEDDERHIELYRIQLEHLAHQPAAYLERREVAEQAVREFPHLPEFHAEYAECLAWVFAYEAARAEMVEALSLFAQAQKADGVERVGMFTAQSCVWAQERLARWLSIEARMAEIVISACVIVKNEEKNIGKWLANAKRYADEIVVVDTGSQDGTKLAVKQAMAGNRTQRLCLRTFPWDDDFSAPRNFALDQAHGDWIVFLDADEHLVEPERVRGMLAEIDVERPQVDAVMVRLVNIDVDQKNREIQRSVSVRFFRRDADLRYVGRVHETVQRAGVRLEAVEELERLTVYHTGYSTARLQQKIQRNLALLQQEIAEGGEQPRHAYYLANCYFVLQDYERALYYAEKAMQAPVQFIGLEENAQHWAAVSREKLADQMHRDV